MLIESGKSRRKAPRGMMIWEGNAGKIHIASELAHRPRDVLFWMPDRTVVGVRRPKSKEGWKRIREKRKEIIVQVFECLEKWNKRFKSKRIGRLIAEIMWGRQNSQDVSERLGVKITFEGSRESAFISVFDPRGMSDGQILNEIAKRKKAVDEATSLYTVRRTRGKFRKLKNRVLTGLK